MFVICWVWPGPEAMTPISKPAANQTTGFLIILAPSCLVAQRPNPKDFYSSANIGPDTARNHHTSHASRKQGQTIASPVLSVGRRVNCTGTHGNAKSRDVFLQRPSMTAFCAPQDATGAIKTGNHNKKCTRTSTELHATSIWHRHPSAPAALQEKNMLQVHTAPLL